MSKTYKSKTIFILILLSACLYGGFYVFSALAMGIICIIFLGIALTKKRQLLIRTSLENIGIYMIAGMYMMSVLWALDPGVAAAGALKISVPCVFALLWENIENSSRDAIWKAVPDVASVTALLSFVLYPFSELRKLCYSAGRLGGTFQYSNTYALFLVVGLMILLYEDDWKRKEIAETIILTVGIIWTGSRSVMVIGVLFIAIHFLRKRGNRRRLWIMLGTAAVAAIVGILLLKLDIGRLIKLTVNSSTLNGRLLYWYDVIPVMLKHPFGLGYMGYFFLQPRFQTGNYVTKFVHNDILQLGIDAGIIPMFILVGIVIKTLLSKKTEEKKKVILLILFLHSLFDFDLQFTIMSCIGMMCIDNNPEHVKKFQLRNKNIAVMILVIIGAVYTYFMIAFGAGYAGNYDLSVKLYPFHTIIREERMNEDGTANDAEWIIKKNGLFADAYEERISRKCEEGDIEGITEDVDKMLENAGYQSIYYNQAVYYLSKVLDTAVRNDNTADTKIILNKIQDIPEKIQKREQNSSALAYRINDKPSIELESSVEEYLEKLSDVTIK